MSNLLEEIEERVNLDDLIKEGVQETALADDTRVFMVVVWEDDGNDPAQAYNAAQAVIPIACSYCGGSGGISQYDLDTLYTNGYNSVTDKVIGICSSCGTAVDVADLIEGYV